MPNQQTQGVQIHGREEGKFATLTEDGVKQRLDVNALLIGSLIPANYDYIALTYVTVGNGIGKIETVTYKTGGSGGTTVAVLTLGYDSSNRLSSVART